MLRQRAKLVSFTVYIVDVAIATSSFFLAYWLRKLPFFSDYGAVAPVSEYYQLALLVPPAWSVLLYYFNLYTSFRTTPYRVLLWKVLKVSAAGVMVMGAFVFIFKLTYISRIFMGIFGLTSLLLLALEKLALKTAANTLRSKGYNFKNILIIGTGRRAREFARVAEEHKHWGLRIIGFITDRPNLKNKSIAGYKVVGDVSEVKDIINNEVVDEIVFAVSRKRLDEFEELFLLCEDLGINTRVPINFLQNMTSKVLVEDLHGIPLLTFTKTPHNVFLLAVKRTLDIALSLALLILVAPLMITVAVLIKLTSRGPVLFRQERVGLYGRAFTLYKFRSMVQDAHDVKAAYEDRNEMDGPVFKIKRDPRVTRVGRFIRKMSIDELPQLINVLKGEMSIVGPRPPLQEEVDKYDHWQRRRLSMKPGLTCLWQVNGRNKVGFKKWIELDLQYIDNWSLKLDLKILFKTIPVVIRGTGV